MPSTVVLEKTPESPLDSKEIKPVNHKGDQLWIFTGRTDVDTEAQVFWSSDENRQLIGKVYDTGKDWGQKEKRASEDETVGWQHLKWTWTWANSGRWWETEIPGMLQFMGLQREDMTGRLNNNNNRGLHLQWWDARMVIHRKLTLLTSVKEQKTPPGFGLILELQLQHQSFQWIFRVNLPYDWLVWSPCYLLNDWLRSKISLGLWRRQVIHPHQSAIIIDREYRTLYCRKSWESM